MQNTVKLKNNKNWTDATVSISNLIERKNKQRIFSGIWYAGTWLNGYWRRYSWSQDKSGLFVSETSIWLNGIWISGTIMGIIFADNIPSKISPKAYFKPRSTLSLNYAKYN